MAAVLAGACALPASANGLPLASFIESVNANCGNDPGPRSAFGTSDAAAEMLSLDRQDSNANSSCLAVASAATVGGFAPQIDLLGQAGANSADGPGLGASVSASGSIDYSLKLSGPVTGGTIAVRVQALIDISGSASGDANAIGRGDIVIPGTSPVSLCSWFGFDQAPQSCQFGPANGGSLELDRLVGLWPGDTYTVSMSGRGTATVSGNDGGGAADFQVIVDPIFSFTNDDDAALYTLEFSPNLVPVPLPAGAWLLGSALAGLAGLRRRRFRRAEYARPH